MYISIFQIIFVCLHAINYAECLYFCSRKNHFYFFFSAIALLLSYYNNNFVELFFNRKVAQKRNFGVLMLSCKNCDIQTYRFVI